MMHLPNRRQLMTAGLISVLLPVVAAGSANSLVLNKSAATTAAPPPTVELLSRGTVARPFKAKANGITLRAKRKIDVAVAHLTFVPGASTGWHTHPGPTTITLIAGTMTVTDRLCRRQTYSAGQTFVENGLVGHLAVNPGDSTTETIVTFLVPAGAPMLTSPASPPRCAGR